MKREVSLTIGMLAAGFAGCASTDDQGWLARTRMAYDPGIRVAQRAPEAKKAVAPTAAESPSRRPNGGIMLARKAAQEARDQFDPTKSDDSRNYIAARKFERNSDARQGSGEPAVAQAPIVSLPVAVAIPDPGRGPAGVTNALATAGAEAKREQPLRVTEPPARAAEVASASAEPAAKTDVPAGAAENAGRVDQSARLTAVETEPAAIPRDENRTAEGAEKSAKESSATESNVSATTPADDPAEGRPRLASIPKVRPAHVHSMSSSDPVQANPTGVGQPARSISDAAGRKPRTTGLADLPQSVKKLLALVPDGRTPDLDANTQPQRSEPLTETPHAKPPVADHVHVYADDASAPAPRFRLFQRIKDAWSRVSLKRPQAGDQTQGG